MYIPMSAFIARCQQSNGSDGDATFFLAIADVAIVHNGVGLCHVVPSCKRLQLQDRYTSATDVRM